MSHVSPAGELGTGGTPGSTVYELAPKLVLGGHTYSSISAGRYHTCAVRATDSALLCWCVRDGAC